MHTYGYIYIYIYINLCLCLSNLVFFFFSRSLFFSFFSDLMRRVPIVTFMNPLGCLIHRSSISSSCRTSLVLPVAQSALGTQACFQHSYARGYPRGGGPPRFGSGGGAMEYNEPTLVAKLLELFPEDKSWIPVSKWSRDIPDHLQEPISRFGGLGKFAASQSNFFIVRKENDLNVVALTPMAMELCRERTKLIKEREKRNLKFAEKRRGRGGLRGARGGSFGRGGGHFGSGGRR